DIWNLIPFENYVVTAELTPEEIKTVVEEVYASREPRNLLGFEIETEGSGYERRIAAVRLADGGTLERDKRYLIAFNTFDSRSAGVNLSEIAVENDRRFGCVSVPCAFSESRQSFCYRLSILAGRR